MSIAPVPSFPPVNREPADVRPIHIAAVPEPAHPVSVTLPIQEKSAPPNGSSTYELPEDVVEVHQDPDIKNQVIVQFLDKAKNVVLQVPSSEELSVERGIAQDVQEAAKLRVSEATAAAVSEAGKTHGH